MFGFLKRKSAADFLPRQTEMEIVCGDCAGDDVYPVKTFLMTDGNCAGCGGRSFVCAVRLSKMLARHLSQIAGVEK